MRSAIKKLNFQYLPCYNSGKFGFSLVLTGTKGLGTPLGSYISVIVKLMKQRPHIMFPLGTNT